MKSLGVASRLALVLSGCLGAAAQQAVAQEWTRFRGPNGTGIGHAPRLPLQWTLKDCLWRVELPGIGHSSPVIWGERLFITSGVEKTGLRVISCLGTSDGRLLWRREFPMQTYPKSPNNSYASATPALDAEHVYLTWSTPEHYLVLALKHSDGSEVWRHDLGPYDGEHGYGASPIVVGRLVIVPNEQNGPGNVVALDAASGAERWKTPRRAKRAAYCTPCLFEAPGAPPQLIFAGWAHGLSSLDPQTGKPLWELPVFTYRVVSSPLVAEGLIFAGCGGGGGGKPFVVVRPGNPAQGTKPEVAYDLPKPAPYVPIPVANGKLVFLWGDQGVVKCLEAATGAVRWQQRVGGSYFGSPVRIDDRIYCMSREGELVVLAAADKYQLLARINLGEPSSSTPAVSKGVMYLRTLSHVMAIGPRPKQAGEPAAESVAGKSRDREDARSPRLSGVFLVCKEYGTVRGTFLTNTRGRDVTRLNFLFGEDVNPRFSPADDRVLFISACGGTPGLWTMNRNGEGRQRICDGDQGDWFPDGRRIAFRRQGRIFARSLAAGEETLVSPAGWKSCSFPACSPDGRKVLFVAREGAKDAVCVATPGQSEPKRLVEGEILGSPRWSPRGERIAYQDGSHLWVIDADGSNRRQLTTAGGIQRRPAWSPDATAIAYSQGPGPNGPWQMAVIARDATGRLSIPPGDARSVLCSDWGVEQSGQKFEPNRMALRPAPRIQVWQVDCPPTATPVDWTAFCRERKGWSAVPVGNALGQSLRGGCAVENQEATLLLLAGMPGAVLVPKSTLQGPIGFALLDRQGRKAGPVESIRLLTCGPDEAALESSAPSAGEPVKVAWAIGGSRALVQVTPRENADRLCIEAPVQCVVLPDRFANDLVVDPQATDRRRVLLPWAPLVTALCGNGSGMFVLICPGQGQRVELREAEGTSFAGADLAFQGRSLWVGAIAQERAWRLERFDGKGSADPVRFKWRMPCSAAWRLAVQGEGQRFSAFFSDKESPLFDKKEVLFRKSKAFSSAVRLGAIYLYGRTAATPPETLTPLDLLRDAIGLAGAEQVLDEEGVTGYRRAAGPTTWADLSATIESLRYLFERQLEVQDSVYAGHLCDDLPRFVEGMDQRLKEYADFARQIAPLCKTLDATSPAATKLLELDRQRGGLKRAEEIVPPVTKIRQLTAKDTSTNREEFEKCCRAIRGVAEPREELLNAYRKLAIEVRDAAGIATARADLCDPAERVRTLCQGVLRNRLYAEADWRGEDYRVPAFWLGPRPYQDAR